jgi:hypothetical protein
VDAARDRDAAQAPAAARAACAGADVRGHGGKAGPARAPSVDYPRRHIESSRHGELLNQDTLYWGTLKGVGKVYVQVIVDVFCSFAFAKVYTSKLPVTACDLVYERVLPFYDALGVALSAVLTDKPASSVAAPTAIPTSCCPRWKASSIERLGSAARAPTASSSA